MASDPQDVSRASANIVLPPEVSAEIWQNIQPASMIMQSCPRTDLPGSGVEVQVIVGDPTAHWYGETTVLKASKPSFANKTMQGYKLGVMVPFSNEFRRDKTALYGALVSRLPGVLAAKFDNTVLYGTDNAGTAPGSNFDTLFDAVRVELLDSTNSKTPYDQFLAAIEAVVDAGNGSDLNTWVIDAHAELIALGAKDANGDPLFIRDLQAQGSIGSILARTARKTPAIYAPGTAPTTDGGTDGKSATVGLGGDFRFATWGQVQGVTVSISDQATITLDDGSTLNLWERDMFAVKANIEAGFRVRNEQDFVVLGGKTPPFSG